MLGKSNKAILDRRKVDVQFPDQHKVLVQRQQVIMLCIREEGKDKVGPECNRRCHLHKRSREEPGEEHKV